MLMPPWIHGAAATEELPSCSTTTLMSRKEHQEIKDLYKVPSWHLLHFLLDVPPDDKMAATLLAVLLVDVWHILGWGTLRRLIGTRTDIYCIGTRSRLSTTTETGSHLPFISVKLMVDNI